MEYLCNETNNRILVAIENNSIGSAIIENLENSSSTSFNYSNYLYVEDSQKDQYKYGIYTSMKSKDQMISILYDYINSEPKLIKSNELINQLSIIEKRSNGGVSAKYGHHDDLFMASCLCAYAKKKTLLDPTYSTLDKVISTQIRKEEDMLFSNIIIESNPRRLHDLDVFSSERELLKSMDDFDDFSF